MDVNRGLLFVCDTYCSLMVYRSTRYYLSVDCVQSLRGWVCSDAYLVSMLTRVRM